MGARPKVVLRRSSQHLASLGTHSLPSSGSGALVSASGRLRARSCFARERTVGLRAGRGGLSGPEGPGLRDSGRCRHPRECYRVAAFASIRIGSDRPILVPHGRPRCAGGVVQTRRIVRVRCRSRYLQSLRSRLALVERRGRANGDRRVGEASENGGNQPQLAGARCSIRIHGPMVRPHLARGEHRQVQRARQLAPPLGGALGGGVRERGCGVAERGRQGPDQRRLAG